MTLFCVHEKAYIYQKTGLSHNMLAVPNREGGLIKQAYRVVADYVAVTANSVTEDPDWLVSPSKADRDEAIDSRKYYRWYASEPRG